MNVEAFWGVESWEGSIQEAEGQGDEQRGDGWGTFGDERWGLWKGMRCDMGKRFVVPTAFRACLIYLRKLMPLTAPSRSVDIVLSCFFP